MAMLTRRSFLKHAGAASAAAAASFAGMQHDAYGQQRPNILWIYADDHAQNAVSAYGSRLAALAPTPNIDRIAREGALFRNSFVTNSICGPCRAVVLTGLHSHLNGFRDNSCRFDGSQETFPKRCGRPATRPRSLASGTWSVNPPALTTGGHARQGLLQSRFCWRGGRTRLEAMTDIITDKALFCCETTDAEKPFMLMVQHSAPREWLPDPTISLPMRMWCSGTETCLTTMPPGAPLPANRHDHRQNHAPGPDLKLWKEEDRHTPSWNNTFERMTGAQRATQAAYKSRNETFWSGNLQGDDLVRFKYQCYMKDYLRCIASIDDNKRLLNYLEETGPTKTPSFSFLRPELLPRRTWLVR